ncbi:tripartite tricarboxylate transporter substrate binding protein [Ramlibacter sp. AW1]|uniref:Tripartite tricarboxylate transporter substrate binding protein n=1 Tax=Ramlibacter aurantiacus TaxID=2801330 RepID=A0A936ZNP2_9BURK|nr:tripartite tricarboxylate transporter substrate binding protein [Ramlibacter aurantiacus]MBL0420685.1 tripartite tricarboxylate transporter substrate binding protein [Ramlibacter aurantiacus]
MHKPISGRRRQLLAAAGAMIATPLIARAQDPIAGGRTITLVVSYAAGGGADLMARVIAPHMSRVLGQTVVVDNRPGAGGQIAAAHVARGAADGSQLLVDASSFAVNPALYPKLPYDTNTAFAPLAVLAIFPNVLVCNPAFPAKTVGELVRMAKEKPGSIAYASSGNGSAQHLAGALFEDRAGVTLQHVPYKGGGPAMNDVMAGQVPLFFANVASSLGNIQAGKLRPLATTSTRRAHSLPAIPTIQEAGVPGYEVLEWNPVLAPAATPAPVRERLAAAVAKAMAEPEVMGRVRALGGEVFTGGSAEAAEFIKKQQALWGAVVRERKITIG